MKRLLLVAALAMLPLPATAAVNYFYSFTFEEAWPIGTPFEWHIPPSPDARFVVLTYPQRAQDPLVTELRISSSNPGRELTTRHLSLGEIGHDGTFELTTPFRPDASTWFFVRVSGDLDAMTITGIVGSPSPEPSTWVLAIMGFAGMGAMLRRSRPGQVKMGPAEA